MREKFIAVSSKGTEYMYNRETMIAVPKASAQKIADLLTKVGYRLKNNEVWSVHDNDWYTDGYISMEIRKCSRSMNVYKYCG